MTSNPFVQHGRFFKGNLHTHSTQSDGQLPPQEVCRRYREAGPDGRCARHAQAGRCGYDHRQKSRPDGRRRPWPPGSAPAGSAC